MKKDKNDKQIESRLSRKEGEKLKQQAGENLAGWQRAKADYENLQKQAAAEKAELIKYANANLLMELLPIMDNFEMAFNMVPEEEQSNAWVVGLQHIKSQMQTFLQNNGVEKIKTVGEKFDPNLHEAVPSEDHDEKKEADVILKEIKAGYKLGDKIIQAAKVVVNRCESTNNSNNTNKKK